MTAIPDWACDRAAKLANEVSFAGGHGSLWTSQFMKVNSLGQAFAKYIAEHEKPPVDPDLIEAREFLASNYDGPDYIADKYRQGYYDTTTALKAVVAAVKKYKGK